MVGHYWLRNPALAPSPEIRSEIEQTLASIKGFAAQIHLAQKMAKCGLREPPRLPAYWIAPGTAQKTHQPQLNEPATTKSLAAQDKCSPVQGATGPFKNLLLIGIGGSALGPQFVSSALGHPGKDKLALFSFDNTDPDGMD